jgi:PTS hybrid protein
MTAERVGVVLVSHSPLLAQGAADLAEQMCGGLVSIAWAGGTDDGRLGTSIDLLRVAVDKVYGDAGVAIIPDLGSSVLTTRAYLEEVDGSSTVALVDAPFVEGAVAAVVAAAAGGALPVVVAAAEETRGVRKT